MDIGRGGEVELRCVDAVSPVMAEFMMRWGGIRALPDGKTNDP